MPFAQQSSNQQEDRQRLSASKILHKDLVRPGSARQSWPRGGGV